MSDSRIRWHLGEFLRAVLAFLFKVVYRVDVSGMRNIEKCGERRLIVANHVSYLDAALLAVFLPGRPVFAIDRRIADRWWVKPWLSFVEVYRLDPLNPFTARAMIKEVKKGKPCVIFPEGRITVTGALMKVFEGPAMIADRGDADVLPVRIDGPQYTVFSRLKGMVRRRWFPKVTLTVLPPRRLDVDKQASGRSRRRQSARQLYDLMCDMAFDTGERRITLYDALLDAKSIYGGGLSIIEDAEENQLTYRRLAVAAEALGRKLEPLAPQGRALGVMLPTANGAAVTFFALQAIGRVPAMINFTAGPDNVEAALKAGLIDTVLTSRAFIERARLEDLVERLEPNYRIVYLEDVRQRIGRGARLRALLGTPFARARHHRRGLSPDDTAVILFTSGSEGTPKGVALTHANMLANRHQMAARIDFTPRDVVLNALPVFHAFGLTGGVLLPLFAGVRTVLYPSPLHYRIVPALAYDRNATIMFGTDTFLSGYARVADPYDFYSLRHVFAGAEKLKEETRKAWIEKFGIRLLEGYGVTETAPVIAVNTPMHYRAGTVGRFIPGIEHRLEPVEGVEDGGRLYVRGPNVMKGYLRAEHAGELDPPPDGWYDTGDIVSIDDEGYVTIVGRAKRFAKVGGEMIALGQVEAQAERLWPDARHAAVTVHDSRRGEKLVLLTEQEDASRDSLAKDAREHGIAPAAVPREVRAVEKVPLLGTGKVDYPAAQKLAEEDADDEQRN